MTNAGKRDEGVATTCITVPRTDAADAIMRRLEFGRQLLDKGIATEAALTEAVLEAQRWTDYNGELLLRLFTTDVFWRSYRNARVTQIHMSPPFSIKLEQHRQYLGIKCNKLQSFLDRLTLIPECNSASQDESNEDVAQIVDAEKRQPRVFIGSSREGHTVAEAIQAGLEYVAECTIWSQGVFGLSEGTLESLVKAVHNYEYAVLVLTPDDVTLKRDNLENSARDNVLFELGLFMGALGRDKTFIVHPRDVSLELPTDLAGVTPATYQSERSDGNLDAAVGPVCRKLKQAMQVS